MRNFSPGRHEALASLDALDFWGWCDDPTDARAIYASASTADPFDSASFRVRLPTTDPDDPQSLWRRLRDLRPVPFVYCSHLPAICGYSPYETPRGMWERDTQPPLPRVTNEGMRRGRQAEPLIRDAFYVAQGLAMVPATFFRVIKGVPCWYSADGYTDRVGRREGLECKLVNRAERDLLHARKLAPAKYLHQSLGALLIGDLDRLWMAWSYHHRDESSEIYLEVYDHDAQDAGLQALTTVLVDYWEALITKTPFELRKEISWHR